MTLELPALCRRYALFFLCLLLGTGNISAQRQMEKLGRGVVALHSATSQAYIGWRLLATDPSDIGFNLYRSANGAAGVKLNSLPLTNTTDYLDTGANFTVSNAWYVVPVTNGVEGAPSLAYGLAANSPVRQYVPIPLVSPGPFAPYDVKFGWVGDFDGDGEYDFLFDRLSTTGGVNQFLQAYKRDGTLLWQVDMGPLSTNTANAYEPNAAAISIGDKDNVTVYDLDGDGRAEAIFRTANGTILPGGVAVTTNNSTSQFLCILDGLTGAERARALIPNPYFADGPLNMHAGIAYLDGIHPSIIFSGENRVGSAAFQRLTVAWDFRDGKLTQRWLYQTPNGQNDSEGHQLRIADANHDGKDDIIRIGSIITELTNGVPTTLYSTELVHGDRYHVTDIDPDRPGLEMFAIQQLNQTLLATSLQDLSSGVLFKKWYSGGITDVGRGIAIDMTPNSRGCEVYSTQPGIFDAKGNQLYANNIWAPEGIWWDADLMREFEDGAGSGALSPVINKFDPASGTSGRLYTLYNEDGGCHQAYGGRAAFWGDILGDWREEFVVVANDYNSVRIYTTKTAATNRLYCLMQNPQYRVQCTYKGYYQASYPDYFLGYQMPPPPPPAVSDARLVWRGNGTNLWDASTANWFTNNLWISNTIATMFANGDSVLFDATRSNATVKLTGSLQPGAVKVHAPGNYIFDGTDGSLDGTMMLTKAGAGKLFLNGTNNYSGATLIGEGMLLVNGMLPNSPITVRGGIWLDGRLAGYGVIGANVSVNEGAGIAPGQGTNSPGTLTIASNLTMNGRTLNNFDLSDDPSGLAKTNDLLVINGNLTLLGTNAIVINRLNGSLPAGSVYPLINYSGTLTGGVSNLTVVGLTGVPLSLTNPPGQIALVIKNYRSPATITWTGGNGGNAWDLLTTSNFLNGATKDQFAPGDTVRFDSVGISNLTVNLTGDLNAAGVVVDSSANYTFTGSGSLLGNASLTKTNSGTLTVSSMNNAYTGKTIIGAGTLVVSELDAVGYPSPLGNPPAGSTNLALFAGATLRITGESYTDRGLTLNAGQNIIEVANAADQVTVAGQIIGSGTLVKSGAGTLALNVANTFTGGVVISNGAVSLGSTAGNQTGVGTGAVTFYNGTLSMINIQASETAAWPMIVPTNGVGRLDADGRCTLSGALTGSGTFTVMTPYVRTDFNGNWSAFSGQLNITTDSDGGDFRCNNSAGYPNAKINLAALVSLQNRLANTPTISIGELSGALGCNASAGGGNSGLGVTWSVGGLNTSATFAGNTYNGINFVKVGTGTWTWSGTNITHTGTTAVNGGTLLINGNAASASGTVTVGASGTLGGIGNIGGAVTVDGKLAPGNNAIGTLVCNGNVTLNSASTTTMEINKTAGTRDLLDGNATLTYGGTLVVTNRAGTLALNDSFKIFDAATYSGSFSSFVLPNLAGGLGWKTTTLSSNGTISVVSVSAAAPDAPTNLVATSAGFSQINLTWSDASTNEESFLIERSTDGSNFTQIASVGVGVTTYPNTGLAGSTTYYYRVRASNSTGNSAYSNIASATTSAAPIGLTWRGDGAANPWDIATTANWRSNDVASVFNNGVVAIFDDSGSNNTAINLSGALSPNAVTANAAKNYTFAGSGSLTGAMQLIKNGGGTLTLSTTNTFTGGVVISNGTVAVGNIGANNTAFGTGMISFYGGTLQFNGYGGNVGTGWGGCTNTLNVPAGQTGSLLLPPRWGYSYPFNSPLIGAGTLNVTVDYVRDYFSGNWSAFTGQINVNTRAGSGDFRVDNPAGYPNASMNLSNGVTLYSIINNLTLDVGELNGSSGSQIIPQTPSSGINPYSFTLRTGMRNTDATFAGNIADNIGIVTIVKNGSGTWTLTGSSTYSGTTTINGGVLQIGEGGTSGTLATNSVNNNATLNYNRADNITDSGLISGTGSVVQDGDGTLTLAKNHTYSGPTLINSGSLALSGSGSLSNSTSINVASGATFDVSGRSDGNWIMSSGKTLTGNGAINGNFILASGARLLPGSGVGTLTFSNNLTLQTGCTNFMELTKSPNASDRLRVLGTLACGGNLIVTNISGSALASGDNFQLFDAQLISGSFGNLTLPALTGSLYWNTNSLYVTGEISVQSQVSNVPTNLVFSASSGSLTLSWPSSHIGWKLQVQTNQISSGLGGIWWDVANSTTTNSVTVPIDPAAPTVFYRLYLP